MKTVPGARPYLTPHPWQKLSPRPQPNRFAPDRTKKCNQAPIPPVIPIKGRPRVLRRPEFRTASFVFGRGGGGEAVARRASSQSLLGPAF